MINVIIIVKPFPYYNCTPNLFNIVFYWNQLNFYFEIFFIYGLVIFWVLPSGFTM